MLYCQLAKMFYFKCKYFSLIKTASVTEKLSLQYGKNKNIRISEYKKQ